MKNYYDLNEITGFAYKVGERSGKRDYVTIYNSGPFWSQSKSKTGRSYSLQEIKSFWSF